MTAGLQEFEADEAAADREEGFVDVVAALVADAEAAVLVEPGDRALDHPALLSESGAVWALGPGDLRLDVPAAQLAPTLACVVGAVADEPLRSATRPSAPSTHRWDRVHERNHLGDVVAVAGGQADRQRCAATAGDHVVLGALS
jgi:hypothetical protein